MSPWSHRGWPALSAWGIRIPGGRQATAATPSMVWLKRWRPGRGPSLWQQGRALAAQGRNVSTLRLKGKGCSSHLSFVLGFGDTDTCHLARGVSLMPSTRTAKGAEVTRPGLSRWYARLGHPCLGGDWWCPPGFHSRGGSGGASLPYSASV